MKCQKAKKNSKQSTINTEDELTRGQAVMVVLGQVWSLWSESRWTTRILFSGSFMSSIISVKWYLKFNAAFWLKNHLKSSKDQKSFADGNSNIVMIAQSCDRLRWMIRVLRVFEMLFKRCTHWLLRCKFITSNPSLVINKLCPDKPFAC